MCGSSAACYLLSSHPLHCLSLSMVPFPPHTVTPRQQRSNFVELHQLTSYKKCLQILLVEICKTRVEVWRWVGTAQWEKRHMFYFCCLRVKSLLVAGVDEGPRCSRINRRWHQPSAVNRSSHDLLCPFLLLCFFSFWPPASKVFYTLLVGLNFSFLISFILLLPLSLVFPSCRLLFLSSV